MDMLAAALAVRAVTLRVATTRPTEFIDVTGRLLALVADARLHAGLVMVQTHHTTTGIVVNEHEPGLLTDFADLLERIAPSGDRYAHDEAPPRAHADEEERRNGHSHCRALLLSTSAGLAVSGGRLQLGRWQRIFLVELDGPQTRELSVLMLGETGR